MEMECFVFVVVASAKYVMSILVQEVTSWERQSMSCLALCFIWQAGNGVEKAVE